jgi:hypothetical protein
MLERNAMKRRVAVRRRYARDSLPLQLNNSSWSASARSAAPTRKLVKVQGLLVICRIAPCGPRASGRGSARRTGSVTPPAGPQARAQVTYEINDSSVPGGRPCATVAAGYRNFSHQSAPPTPNPS